MDMSDIDKHSFDWAVNDATDLRANSNASPKEL